MISTIIVFLVSALIGGTMNISNVHWLGHATFRIEDGARQIYIDPYKLPAKAPAADIVLITHAHYDHYSERDIAKIRKEGTIVVAPNDLALQIGKGCKAVVPNETYNFGGWKIRTIPAYNLVKEFHSRGKRWVGYVITLQNGMSIYHAGDTDGIPEMRTVTADIALVPCGGTYTMSASEAAEAATTFKPKVLIPIHWGDIVGSKTDADEVKKLYKGETVILKPER